jgi:phospholipid/cholesterol/gamma-HCH transport system permease protein
MKKFIDIELIGRSTINSILQMWGYFSMLKDTIIHIPSLRITPVRTVLYKQLYFTGLQSLSKLAIIGLLIGVVIITQVSNIVGYNAVLIGKILIWVVIRELGPLLCAMIIIARSSPAIASELGAMKINNEINFLKTMGINADIYLILPRIIGISLSVMIVTLYFQIISMFGALALSSFLFHTPLFQNFTIITTSLHLYEIIVSSFKSLTFGIIISIISCYHGMLVQSSITEIPQAASIAVTQSLFYIFLIDGIITLITFL